MRIQQQKNVCMRFDITNMMNIDKCAVQLLDNYLAGMKIKPVVRYHYPPPGTTK